MERWPKLRMAKVLGDQKEKLGSFVKLEEDIQRASEIKVDRRKLTKIVAGDNVTLSLKELVGLDAYLSRLGQGLAETPLFEVPQILRGFVDRGSVLFFLGSFPGSESQRADLSIWDVRAMMEIQDGINDTRPETRVNMKDVEFVTDEMPDPNPRISRPELFDTKTSVCCLGSSRACWAAELMLAEMFNVRPFDAPNPTLPLHFVWAPKLKNASRPSTFALPLSALKKLDPDFSSKDERALIVNGQPFVTRVTKAKNLKDYGVIVAQRRKTGQAFVVIAGLSAPATYATALAFLNQRTGTLPMAPNKKVHGPIRLAVIEVAVRGARGKVKRDMREVEKTEVVHSALYEPLEYRPAS